jgi:hypothetical protein
MPQEPVLEAETLRQTLPSSIEMLGTISTHVVNAGGKILRWRYSDNSVPLMGMELQGINTLEAHDIFNQLEYASIEDIRDVRYIDGNPHYTIHANAEKSTFSILTAGIFPGQNLVIPMIIDLTNAFRRQEISIISEVLPTDANGNHSYSVTYTSKDWNLIRSFEIIDYTCIKYRLMVKDLEVAINSENNRFTVVCSLSPCDTPVNVVTDLGGINKIPAAFGYKEPRLTIVPKFVEEPIIEPEPVNYQFIVGSIRDADSRTVFYRETRDGKIQVKVIYE